VGSALSTFRFASRGVSASCHKVLRVSAGRYTSPSLFWRGVHLGLPPVGISASAQLCAAPLRAFVIDQFVLKGEIGGGFSMKHKSLIISNL
jgi:hypothetical protein